MEQIITSLLLLDINIFWVKLRWLTLKKKFYLCEPVWEFSQQKSLTVEIWMKRLGFKIYCKIVFENGYIDLYIVLPMHLEFWWLSGI